MFNRVSLVITEDHAFTRAGMQQKLIEDGRFNVLGDVGSAVDAIKLVRKLRPDLAVIDYGLPDASGLELLIELRRWVPDCKVAVLTGRDDVGIVQPLLDAGASGVLSKTSPAQLICDQLAQIAGGEKMIAGIFSDAMEEGAEGPSLTAREFEVLVRIAKGMSNPAIASDMALSPKTVESHRASLMRKLDVKTTATLMIKATRAGLLDL